MLKPEKNIYISAIIIYNNNMEVDFSNADKILYALPLALKTVYMLRADITYDINGKYSTTSPENSIIALRTIGGKGKVRIAGHEEFTVFPETLMFFKRESVIRYYCSGKTWDFWWFEFYPAENLSFPLNKIMNIDIVDNESDICYLCLKMLRRSDKASLLTASSSFNLLLYKWITAISYNNSVDNISKHNIYQAVIEKAINYIKSNISGNLSIRTIAGITGLCERRFRQIFKSQTGLQPKRYIDLYKINMAEELLKNTPFSLAEISQRLGYSTQFHFSKAFKKSRGVPPSCYRKKI
jgi:AraC-like DNA-binding protein